MTNEVNTTLTGALNQSSSVIAFFNYDLVSLKYNLDWTHGSLHSLKLGFYVQSNSVEVCRFDFQVECFWEHLREVLKEEDGNTQQFHDQVKKCNKNLEDFHNGPTGREGIVNAISSLNQLALQHPTAK